MLRLLVVMYGNNSIQYKSCVHVLHKLYVLAGLYNNPLISLSVIYTYPDELDIMDTTVTTRSASYLDIMETTVTTRSASYLDIMDTTVTTRSASYLEIMDTTVTTRSASYPDT